MIKEERMTPTKGTETSRDKQKKKILESEKEDIITSKQAKALVAKVEGKTLSSKNRTYIYSLKQIIERGEKNAERVEALKSLLLLLGISPEIGRAKEQTAEKVCYHCNTQTVWSIQNLYRKTPLYTIILEDIPVFDCPNCDNFYLANDTLRIEDQLLQILNHSIKSIQEQSFPKSTKDQPCPVCQYKYLEQGQTEVYRFRRHEFHLIIPNISIPLVCEQCGYLLLHDKTIQAIKKVMETVHEFISKLRRTGWRKSPED